MIEQVLADVREDAATLRRCGQSDAAAAMEALLDRVCASLREYLTWHDEKGAVVMSGKPAGYYQARFQEWEERGLARSPRRGVRQYREAVIPKPRRLSDVQVEAERLAREDAA